MRGPLVMAALLAACSGGDAPRRAEPRDLASAARELLAALPPPPTDALTGVVPMEDPSGRALDPLYAALARAARGEGTARIVFYGGSHTASDLYTGTMRVELQRAFGDAGHGFVLAAPPISGYWQRGARVDEAEGWDVVTPSSKRTGVEHYGLAGIAFESSAAHEATARVATDGSRASRVEVSDVAQPSGGALGVRIDGVAHVVETAAPAPAAGRRVFALADAEHTVELRARGRVRVSGLVFERGDHGVVVDQLGLAGAKARHLLLWDESTWGPLFDARAQDLVAVSYGTNEADDVHLAHAQHEDHFRRMLARLRARPPSAPSPALGTTERHLRVADGSWRVPSLLAVLAAQQRAIAIELGCAYADLAAWQGGPGAVERWLAADPPLMRDDRVHYTDPAYHRLAHALLRAWLAPAARDRASTPRESP